MRMYYILQFNLVCIILVLFNNIVYAKPTITCNAELDDKNSELLKVSYDCSGQSLNWNGLENIIAMARSASNLNLATNNFDPIISNKSFNLFKTLSNTLNLSSNSLNAIESHAFYYEVQLTQSGNLAPLQISSLDLSRNEFALLPWTSVSSLPNLQYLYLNSNENITSLDMGDLGILNENKEYLIFTMLKYLYLQSCQIDYVDHRILKYLNNLVLLDLSFNNLKHLDSRVGTQLTNNNLMQIQLTYTSLNLKDNPLECDCKLLWLKQYLLQYGKDSGQYCLINHSVKQSVSPTLVSIETVYLDGQNNRGERLDLKDLEEQITYSVESKPESIINLDNDLFMCEIEFDSTIKTTDVKRIKKTNFFKIQLTCVVNGYPRPVIRWSEGNKALHKNIDKIEETVKQSNDSYTVTSQLILEKSYETSSDIEYRNYSCRTKFESTLKSDQKMILFKIFNNEKDNYAAKLQGSRAHHEDNHHHQQQQQQQQPQAKQKSDTYWFILLLCILIAFVFMLFASVCIVRNVAQSYKLEKKIIEKEKVFNSKRNSTYSYAQQTSSSSEKQQHQHPTINTYSTSTTTSTTRNSAHGLLKPDVIRPHHDFSTSFINVNNNNNSNRSVSRHSSPNSDSLFFSSPISLVPKRNTTNNHDDSNELDNLLSNNQSYDNQPTIDNSLLFDDSNLSTTSSKSFDENIEQYQEPQFDDLSKPVANNKNKTTTNRNEQS